MNKIEGSINISQVPYVTIADKPLQECSHFLIQREILALVSRLDEKRERIRRLESYLKSLSERTPHEWLKEDIEELLRAGK